MRLSHGFEPVFDSSSRVLILGSFPSVQSRENGFYYGHMRNRFWPLLADIFADTMPVTIAEKQDFLLRHGVALWDVVQSCEIEGSSDASIRDVIPNDVPRILADAPIARILTNGRTANTLYRRFLQPLTGIEAICLPSTSPANAAWSMKKLRDAWEPVLNAACISTGCY